MLNISKIYSDETVRRRTIFVLLLILAFLMIIREHNSIGRLQDEWSNKYFITAQRRKVERLERVTITNAKIAPFNGSTQVISKDKEVRTRQFEVVDDLIKTVLPAKINEWAMTNNQAAIEAQKALNQLEQKNDDVEQKKSFAFQQQLIEQSLNSESILENRTQIPKNFDWEVYLLYYPELKEQGIKDKNSAEKHYILIGSKEQRVYQRLKVMLRYTACSGLMNQQYSHLSALALAVAIGAELVLPSSAQRDSFGTYFHTDPQKNQLHWQPAPIEGLIDVDQLIKYWKYHNIIIHKTPKLGSFPDFNEPQNAFPSYIQKDVDLRFRTYLADIYMKLYDLPTLVQKVRKTVISFATKLQQESPDVTVKFVVLDCPCTFFTLNTENNLPLVSKVAQSIEFASDIKNLAQEVVKNLPMGFNGVHLRVEHDAKDWETILGGERVMWGMYISAMVQAKFNSSSALYIASGLLTYPEGQEIFRMKEQEIVGLGLASQVFYKEQFLGGRLQNLTTEQRALVDFLVLVESGSFVGIGSSTFSFYLQEYKALVKNQSKASTVLVGTQRIGTDSLFQKGGHLTI